VTEGRDREREAEAEPGCNPERGDRLRANVHDDGDSAEAEEEEQKRAERFGTEAYAEGVIHHMTSESGVAAGSARSSRFLFTPGSRPSPGSAVESGDRGRSSGGKCGV
jgi:hypothetical protein